MTRVNSIEIPIRFVDVAESWHNGSDCMLYAVASTGALATGTDCPVVYYDDEDDRMKKWYLHLWRELSGAVGSALQVACDEDDEDIDVLDDFDCWVTGICNQLADEYGLTEWELCNG